MKRRKAARAVSMLLALTMTSLLAAGCGQKSAPESSGSETGNAPAASAAAVSETAYKDTLTIAHWEEPTTLDPQAQGKMSCGAVSVQIYDNLITMDENNNPVPSLAEKWEQIDDTTFRFYLRDGVKFHNGDPLTAEDVCYTIARACTNPGSSSIFKSVDGDNTKAIDDLTVEIKLKTPDASIFDTLQGPRGGIVCKRAVEEMGEDAFGHAPVGSGPYKLSEWQTGTEIRLTANEDYWGDAPETPNIVFKIITESANRVIEMETGNADICLNVLASEVARLEEAEGLHVEMDTGYQYTTVTFNMQDPVLSDIRVRQALVYAIDRDAIVKAVYKGTATVADSIMPTTLLGAKTYDPNLYDVEKAKELLAEAGYADGLTLNFVVQPLEEMQRITEAIQNMWKQIGVETNISTAEVAAYLAQGNTLQVGIRNGSASDPANTLIIYDSAFGDRLNSNDEVLDKMLADAKTIYDIDERANAYYEICDYLWEAKWSLPIAFKNTIYAVSDKVEGFEFDRMNFLDMKKIRVAE